MSHCSCTLVQTWALGRYVRNANCQYTTVEPTRWGAIICDDA